MNKNEAVVVTFDKGGQMGEISWVPATDEDKKNHASEMVCGGYLFGDEDTKKHINLILFGDMPFTLPTSDVAVLWTRYGFSPERDQPADVVSAMVEAAGSRALINDVGLNILYDALPQLSDPENNRDDVIY